MSVWLRDGLSDRVWIYKDPETKGGDAFTLVLLLPGEQLAFYGAARAKCVVGHFDLLGASLNQYTTGWMTVAAPFSDPALVIRCVSGSDNGPLCGNTARQLGPTEDNGVRALLRKAKLDREPACQSGRSHACYGILQLSHVPFEDERGRASYGMARIFQPPVTTKQAGALQNESTGGGQSKDARSATANATANATTNNIIIGDESHHNIGGTRVLEDGGVANSGWSVQPFNVPGFYPVGVCPVVDGGGLSLPTVSKAAMSININEPRRTSVKLAAVGVPDSWERAATFVINERVVRGRDARVCVIGRRNAGKSTFLRYLHNRLLSLQSEAHVKRSSSSSPTVYWLDADPGQGQFALPGTVALRHVCVPAFAGQSEFICEEGLVQQIYTGAVSPSADPALYQEAVSSCFHEYLQCRTRARSLPDSQLTPHCLLVNCVGWVTGLGWDLLVGLLQCVRPNVVVTLDVGGSTGSAPANADSCSLMSFPMSASSVLGPDVSQLLQPCLFVSAESMHAGGSARRHTPLDLPPADRRRAVLSTSFLPLRHCHWLTVPWSRFAVRIMHSFVAPSHTLVALDGSLVALCSPLVDRSAAPLSDETKQNSLRSQKPATSHFVSRIPSLGQPSSSPDGRAEARGDTHLRLLSRDPLAELICYAVLHSIDMKNRLFHLVVPGWVAPEHLQKVSFIIKGMPSLEVPSSFAMPHSTSCTEDTPGLTLSDSARSVVSAKAAYWLALNIHDRGAAFNQTQRRIIKRKFV